MIDERHEPNFIVKVASQVLAERLGGKIRLRAGKTFSTWGSIVIRCYVADACTDTPATFIVKKVKEDQFEYDPDSAEASNLAHWIFNDWAAAQFLNTVSDDPPLSPLFYGGSREFGLVVLEDLGDGEGPHTSEALHGDDPDLATRTLIEHAELIGRLHAATIGHSEEYRRIRCALGPVPNPAKLYQDPWSDARGHSFPTGEIDEAISLYQAGFKALGIRPRSGVEDEIRFITAAVEQDPGPLLAYCKGDQNGAGDYIRRDGKPRLLDFNAGGFRHALIEGMPGRMTWGCLMRIPSHILPAMEKAYQFQLAQGYAEVSDDSVFYRSMAQAGARWNIFHVIHRLPEALENDRQRGPTTLRQQVVAWIEAFANLSEEFGEMRALGESAHDMVKRLRALWPAEVSKLPYYPAFRDEK